MSKIKVGCNFKNHTGRIHFISSEYQTKCGKNGYHSSWKIWYTTLFKLKSSIYKELLCGKCFN